MAPARTPLAKTETLESLLITLPRLLSHLKYLVKNQVLPNFPLYYKKPYLLFLNISRICSPLLPLLLLH